MPITIDGTPASVSVAKRIAMPVRRAGRAAA